MKLALVTHENQYPTLPQMPDWVTAAPEVTVEDVSFLPGAICARMREIIRSTFNAMGSPMVRGNVMQGIKRRSFQRDQFEFLVLRKRPRYTPPRFERAELRQPQRS